ncbi:methyltransferase domain-containing protein [Legionella gratiana]|nr:methyltransferase domain-containing protein [Legionella gratiana]
MDGHIPRSLLPSETKMVKDAQKELKEWIDRIRLNEVITFEREKLTIPLTPKQLEYQNCKLGDFSEFNKSWSIKHSKKTHQELQKNPEDWFYYHSLYRENRKTWLEIPYIEIAKRITRPEFIVADLGCGENLLKQKIPNKVLSFDHIAIDDSVVACDISALPLANNQVDVAVLSLALMGSNSDSYVKEAYRILRNMGFIIIAEPSKKWAGKIDDLVKIMTDYGFTQPIVTQTEQFFYLQSFKL